MTDEELREKAISQVKPLLTYPISRTDNELAERVVDQLISLIREETLKEVGEWMLDVYDRTPRGEKMALLEKVIEYLVAGQMPKEE
uniref:Uncharacterized protein n=1 Tax=viral metagenome TaxID=1070528 RepID=A0A6H2A2T2_9ZZZZ